MRVMTAPQKIGVGLEANLRSIRRFGPRVVGFTELDPGSRSILPTVRKVLGRSWQVIARDVGSHSEEVAVAVRTGPFTKVLGVRVEEISPNLPGPGVGNDRYLTTVRLRHYGRVYVVLNVHTNAVVQNLHTGTMRENERKRVTAVAMKTVEERAGAAIADPEVSGVFVLGDFNILPVEESREWTHSPQATFRRLGMTWANTRVVYLAYSKGVEPSVGVVTIPAHSARNRADHGWLLGTFRPRTKTHRKP